MRACVRASERLVLSDRSDLNAEKLARKQAAERGDDANFSSGVVCRPQIRGQVPKRFKPRFLCCLACCVGEKKK